MRLALDQVFQIAFTNGSHYSSLKTIPNALVRVRTYSCSEALPSLCMDSQYHMYFCTTNSLAKIYANVNFCIFWIDFLFYPRLIFGNFVIRCAEGGNDELWANALPQVVPSENECRPYIEKAIKRLTTDGSPGTPMLSRDFSSLQLSTSVTFKYFVNLLFVRILQKFHYYDEKKLYSYFPRSLCHL